MIFLKILKKMRLRHGDVLDVEEYHDGNYGPGVSCMTRDSGGFIFCLQRCDIGIKSDDTDFNFLLQILQKLWYTI